MSTKEQLEQAQHLANSQLAHLESKREFYPPWSEDVLRLQLYCISLEFRILELESKP